MSIRHRCPIVWNYLPDKLKSAENREHFKSMLKRHTSYLNAISLAKETSFNHKKAKDLFISRKVMHSFITFHITYIFITFITIVFLHLEHA